jgi:YD repeat-containing protein
MTAGAGRTVTPTAFNMTTAIVQGATTFALTYDDAHNRITQTAPSGTTTYLNDPISGSMSESVVSGATTTWHDYLSVDGQLIAMRSCTGVAPCSTGATMDYLTLDHLGSIAAVTNDAATVVERDAYDPWGPAAQRQRHRRSGLQPYLDHHARLHRPRAHARHLRDQRQCPHLRAHDRTVPERRSSVAESVRRPGLRRLRLCREQPAVDDRSDGDVSVRVGCHRPGHAPRNRYRLPSTWTRHHTESGTDRRLSHWSPADIRWRGIFGRETDVAD